MDNSKVIHFLEGFSINEINDVLSKRNDVIYYTRYITESSEFHIVKHREGKYVVTSFISELITFYRNNKILSEQLINIKIKGNDNFTILMNTEQDLINQIKNDLNVLFNK